MENSRTIPKEENEPEEDQSIVWLLKGFIFPCWSRKYYKRATQKRVFIAVIFLLIFAFVQSSITTIQVAFAMKNVRNEISGAYEREELPTIWIEDGIARTDSQDQFFFSDKRTVVEIDLTGYAQGIDTSKYSEGILLTHNELHFVNDDGYQEIPLVELHEYFGNPIVLDKTQVLELWEKATSIIDIAAFFGIFFWNAAIRFAYIALLGLLVWGVFSIKYQEVGFNQILITGIYSNVPSIYLSFFIKKIGIGFCGLYTILILIIWTFAMYYVLKAEDKELEIIDSGVY